MKTILTMKLLKDKYGVCRFDKNEQVPSWALKGDFYSITKTEDELSVVCLEENINGNIKYEDNWRVLKIEGPLDFSLVGILAKISGLMADNSISIFAISTYDTDYILIKNDKIENAINIFENNKYKIVRE